MQKLVDINETVAYMKDGDIVTSNGKDLFCMKENKVYRFSDSSHFGLELKDFIDLYKNNSFYLYEEAIEIDDKKDEEYYRYYKK